MSDMKRFNALKKVRAKPMSRQEYNDLRCWDLPADEDGSDKGYLVEDINAPANIDGYSGYVSWTPNDIFEDQFYEADDRQVQVGLCTAPKDPDHVLTGDEIVRLAKTGSLCDCAKDIFISGETSDGYHTFNELYYHRMVLFSLICNNNKEVAFKSKLHADGTMFDDYFIVGVNTPNGYYTYHYHMDDWDMFDVEEVEKAPEWDGHKPSDIRRLLTL